QVVEVQPGEVAQVTLALGAGRPSPVVVARWTLAAAGVVLLVGGAVLAAEASASAHSLEGAIAREAQTGLPTTDYSTVQGFDRNGRAFSAASIACLTVGGALLATGAALFLVPRTPHEKAGAGKLTVDASGVHF